MLCVCVCICVNGYTHTYCVCVCICVNGHTHTYFMCAYVCVCVCIWSYKGGMYIPSDRACSVIFPSLFLCKRILCCRHFPGLDMPPLPSSPLHLLFLVYCTHASSLPSPRSLPCPVLRARGAIFSLLPFIPLERSFSSCARSFLLLC